MFTPGGEASMPPATPAKNAARAKAHSLYTVVRTPAESAVASLWRIAAHARPGLVFTCQNAMRNMTIATQTQ